MADRPGHLQPGDAPTAALDAAVPDNPSIQWNVHHHLINHAVAVATGMGATFPIRRRAPPGAMSAPPGGEVLVRDPQRTAARLQRLVTGHMIPSPQPACLWRLTDVNVKEPGMRFFALKTMIRSRQHRAGQAGRSGDIGAPSPADRRRAAPRYSGRHDHHPGQRRLSALRRRAPGSTVCQTAMPPPAVRYCLLRCSARMASLGGRRPALSDASSRASAFWM